jgi:hypothetical protein
MTAGGYRGAVLGAVLVFAGALWGVPVVSGSPGGVGVVADSAGTVTTDVATAVSDAVKGADDENEAPLADAGLDQEVPVNATVYLDASGSRDPDGSIESYEWSIERPDGNHIEPACADCARTEFRVTMNGTYEMTVTVTDDDGATSSDTLYVQANHVEGPSVELSGPVTVSPGSNTTYTATATAGASPLMNVEWELDGSEMADRQIGGESATDDLTVGLESGTRRLTVRVVSEMGRTDTTTLTINASTRPAPPCEGATWNETAGWWDVGPCDEGNGEDDGEDESCYDAQSDRAKKWEERHPNKEFACYNDVWFGGQNPTIIDTNENDRFKAMGVSVGWNEAQQWTDHPNMSIETVSGFKRLNFATQQVWRNAKRNGSPFNYGDDGDEGDDGDDGGDGENGDDGDDGSDHNDGDDEGGNETPCNKLPERIQYELDRCS